MLNEMAVTAETKLEQPRLRHFGWGLGDGFRLGGREVAGFSHPKLCPHEHVRE